MSALVTAVCRCGHRFDHHRGLGDPRGCGCWRCECAEYDGARLQAAKDYPLAHFVPVSLQRVVALRAGKGLEWLGARLVSWAWGGTR